MDTRIPGWDIRAVQTSAGWLAGDSRDLQIDGLQILKERYQHVSTNQFGTAPRDCVVIGVPLHMQMPGRFNGRDWGFGISAWDGRREFDSIVPPMDLFSIVVNRGLLIDYMLETEGIDLSSWLARGCTLSHNNALTADIGRRIDDVFCAAFDQRLDLSALTVQHRLRDAVLEILGPLIVEHLGAQSPPQDDISPMIVVRRARDHALAHINEPLQVLDLCRATRVSRRTLQASFQEVLGIRPLHYLHALRLDGAHRQLRTGQPGLMVKAVAEHWGFWHLSRFGQAYRATFGELPSDTLRRAQAGQGHQPPLRCAA